MNTILGIDVGKKWLDVCSYYNQETKPLYQRFLNDDNGHKELIDYLDQQPVKLVVCEPTGGYERIICQHLYTRHIPIHQVDTYTFHLFRKSVAKYKTDKHDAYVLALYGDERKLKANYSYQVEREQLKKQQQRREDLVATLSNEKKRLHHSQINIDKESIERHIDFLENEIKIIDKALNKTVTDSNQLQEKASILQTIPGIGKCLATKLVSALPELGNRNYTSNQLAALVGIAPYSNDSGKIQGKRFIKGGRKIPRDALYMAILAGAKGCTYLKSIYDRLLDKCKPKKVAIVACMRKLLEMAHKLIQNKRAFVNNLKTDPKLAC